MGIGQFQLNLNFGSIPVLLHDHTPSHSTGHEKIHCIWYPECQNWTIFSDFSSENPPCPLELIAFVTFLTLNTIMRHFVYFYMIKHPLDQSGMKKNIELGTQNVKIGPFSAILGPQT